MLKVCMVCNDGQQLYKCPRCRLPYCSVSCYKSHCVTCSAPEQADDAPADLNASGIQNSSSGYVTHDTDTVPSAANTNHDDEIVARQRLERLSDSAELKGHLKSERLRNLLSDVSRSETPGSYLRHLLTKDKEFADFSATCLDIVSSDNVPILPRSTNNMSDSAVLDLFRDMLAAKLER